MSQDQRAVPIYASIGRFPQPSDVDLDVARSNDPASAQRLLDQWSAVVGPVSGDGGGDREDFWEAAARLDAVLAVAAEHDTPVWLDAGRPSPRSHAPTGTGADDDDGGFSSLDAMLDDLKANPGHPSRLPDRPARVCAEVRGRTTTGRIRPEDDVVDDVLDGRTVHYGPIRRYSPLWAHADGRAEGYMRTSTFAEFACRRFALAGPGLAPARPDGDLAHVMSRFAAEGIGDVVVKAVQAKHGIWRLATSLDVETNQERLSHALGWAMVRTGESPESYVVQQFVPMRFEYRVFVAHGEPVTGAGCIEEHTPLDARGTDPFSTLLREHRGWRFTEAEADLLAMEDLGDGLSTEPGSVIVDRPDVTARLVDCARRFARAARSRDELPSVYVVDVALGPDDEPLVIECNGVHNSGLYATRPRIVAAAIYEAGPHASPRWTRRRVMTDDEAESVGPAERSAADAASGGA